MRRYVLIGDGIMPSSMRLGSALLLIVAGLSAEASARPVTTMMVGLERPRLEASIDCMVDVEGYPVHFFTDKRTEYLGWYFNVTHQVPLSRNFGYGYLCGVGMWKTEQWMNWEMPDYFVSLDPTRASLGLGYADPGLLLYARFGPLKVIPYVSVPLGVSRLCFSIDDVEELGTAFHWGVGGGTEVHLGFGGVWLACGVKAARVLTPTSRYEVEEGVTLRGKFGEISQEVYFGLSVRVN